MSVDHLARDHLKMALVLPVPTADVAAIQPNQGSTQHSRRQPQSSTGQLTKIGRYVAGPEDRRGRIRLGRF